MVLCITYFLSYFSRSQNFQKSKITINNFDLANTHIYNQNFNLTSKKYSNN